MNRDLGCLAMILAAIVIALLVQSGFSLHSGDPVIHFTDGTSVSCKTVTALEAWVFCDQGTTTEDGIPLKFAYLSSNIERIDGHVKEIK